MRIIILVVAGVAAILAAFLVHNIASQSQMPSEMQAVQQTIEVEIREQEVLIASGDLRTGMLITPDELEWANWPESRINPAYFTKELYPNAIEDLTGSVVRVATYSSEPILPQKIVQKGDQGFMAAVLGPGLRAAAVEISPESASAGFILPDDRVDVILTKDSQAGFGDSFSTNVVSNTILENVRVLAIDQNMGDVDGIPTLAGSTATLELKPEQAELMALATRSGTVSLTLRSVADAEFNDGQAMTRTGYSAGNSDVGNTIIVYRSGKAEGRGS